MTWRPRIHKMTSDWIQLKEAARLLRVNEKKLRAKNPAGDYRFYPNLTRLQPDGPGSRIYLLRSEIERRIGEVEAAARPQALATSIHRSIAQSDLERLKTMNAGKTLSILGIK